MICVINSRLCTPPKICFAPDLYYPRKGGRMPAEAASGGGDLDSGGARRFRTHVKCRVYFANVGMFVNVPRVCVEQAVGPSMPNKRGDAASAMGGERGQPASN